MNDTARGQALRAVFQLTETDPEEILPHLQTLVQDAEQIVRTLSIDRLVQIGQRLHAGGVQRVKDFAAAYPDDLASRVLLIAHLWKLQSLSPDQRNLLESHILWLISVLPRSEFVSYPQVRLDPVENQVAYSRGRELWLAHVNAYPDDPIILDHAANFFTLSEPEISSEILEKGKQLEPWNPEWYRRIAHLQMLGLHNETEEVRLCRARAAMVNLENAILSTKTEEERSDLLADLSKAAFEAGELERAREHASELISRVSQRMIRCDEGDAVHRGNTILGRIAVRDGDRERAKIHLLESGRVSGTPVLQSFGPSMKLAHELLLCGEREVVLEYLSLCASFWQSPQHYCQQWIYAIEHGELPDFGPNLGY